MKWPFAGLVPASPSQFNRERVIGVLPEEGTAKAPAGIVHP